MWACMLSHFNCVQLFANLWTVAHKVPLSKGFSDQEHTLRCIAVLSSRASWPRDWTHVSYFPALAGSFFTISTTVCTKLLQWCPTLCDPLDCSLPDSSVRGILQARILEWVAIPFSRHLPDPGMEPTNLMSPVLVDEFFTTRATCVCSSIFN